MFRPRVIVVAVLAVAAAAAIFSFLPFQPRGLAQSIGTNSVATDRTPAPNSVFFGSATSRDNNFFLNSLLSIYKDRYVPDTPANGGHFHSAQSSSRKGSAQPANRGGSQTVAQPTPRGVIGVLKGGVDQNVETKPIQRQIAPDVAKMVGPFSLDTDLRDLPYIAPTPRDEVEPMLMRHPPTDDPVARANANILFSGPKHDGSRPSIAPSIPMPLQTFEGVDSNASGCGCLPPDTDGDVGSNHYIQSENSSIRITDKQGNFLAGPITYNSFFSAMGTATPCGNSVNGGDGIVFYDHMADRWIVSDFAFPAFPGTAFYQCIGVAKTSDPIAGGWNPYAVQVDPANPTYLGDYPKFGMWPDAYYLAVNEFSNNTTFNGVRVYALDRNSMVNGGSANAVGFSILPADLGDQYSLVPASFRTGNAPPAGQPEWFMDVNSSAAAGTSETQVFVRRFHVDFATPANSTFGVGATHSPDGIITVNGFKDAFSGSAGTLIVPNGTATTTQFLDTLGDKLMYPIIYQNRGGVESVYAVHTTAPNLSADGSTNNGPTAVTWYQFNMTGNAVPATPAQQQEFTNNNDGLYRSMPSINVDTAGNMLLGYTAASTTVNPGIRYAGRLVNDTASTLAQGEQVMTSGTGHQTSTSGRWGDYSSMFVDPSDGCTFYHTNEYYSAVASSSWRTKVGLIRMPGCVTTPIPTPTPPPAATPTPSPIPPVSAGPITVTATAGTTGPTDYPTLQAAFAAISIGTHQGVINVAVLGDTTETLSAILTASGAGGANYSSVTVTPKGVRTISGNLALPLVDLSGARGVVFDGLNSGGNSLTLSNTNNGAVAGTSTVRFINGAQNDVVMRCSILGSSTVALGAAGGNVLFSTTTAVGTNIVGNNNNLISQNNIGPAGANLPIKAVTGLGTAGNNTVNTGDVIDSNNIFDFFGTGAAATAGIDIRAGNQGWTVSNNRIYQTAPRSFNTSVGLRYSGILFSGTTGAGGNFITITGNTIGFGAANGTGTTTISGSDASGLQNEVRGIDLQGASSGTATSVQGNTITGINQTSSRLTVTTGLSAFAGIQASTLAGASATGIFDIGTVTGNTIGSLDGSSTIVINASSVTASTTPVFGILAFSGSSNTISNNKIGAITIQGAGTVTGFRGIFPGTTAATTQTITNNTIGGAVAAGAITDTQAGNYSIYGIQTSTAACNITGNVIRNFVGNANVAGSVNESGIAFTSTSTTAISIISRNTISNLTNSSGAVATNIYGLDVTLSTSANVTGNIIERNFIHSLVVNSTDTTSQIYGLIVRGAGTGTVQNNMIRVGIDSSGNSITGGYLIRGIRDSTGSTAVSYYYNSVYVGGSGVVSASNSTAFFSDAITSTRNYKDNIFFNARSNASGTGKNYAIAVGGTTPNPAGLTSNYNDLFANGTGGVTGLFNATDANTLADWKAATGQDANSISADPLFVAPTGTSLAQGAGSATLWQTIANLVSSPSAVVDLHLQPGSPAIGAGIQVQSTNADPLIGVANDFDGNIRLGRPTLGASNALSPTAARVGISGRVLTNDGAGLRGATVVMRDSSGNIRTVITSAFGYYHFDEVEQGNYVVAVQARKFTYGTRIVNVNDELADLDFTPQQ